MANTNETFEVSPDVDFTIFTDGDASIEIWVEGAAYTPGHFETVYVNFDKMVEAVEAMKNWRAKQNRSEK